MKINRVYTSSYINNNCSYFDLEYGILNEYLIVYAMYNYNII